MATRRDIRDAFYSELVTHASGSHTVTYGDGSTDTITLDAANVDLIAPEPVEERPAVIYDEDHTGRLYNGVGAAPHRIERDQNGDVTAEIWREYMTATFQIRVEADSEIEKEPIYEAIRSGFKKYNFAPWAESDLHPDVTNVDVLDANSTDYTDQDQTIRVDDIIVEFDWHRDFDLTDENIDSVTLGTDADNDDVVEDTYTIN